jgi:hypothetical protein
MVWLVVRRRAGLALLAVLLTSPRLWALAWQTVRRRHQLDAAYALAAADQLLDRERLCRAAAGALGMAGLAEWVETELLRRPQTAGYAPAVRAVLADQAALAAWQRCLRESRAALRRLLHRDFTAALADANLRAAALATVDRPEVRALVRRLTPASAGAAIDVLDDERIRRCAAEALSHADVQQVVGAAATGAAPEPAAVVDLLDHDSIRLAIGYALEHRSVRDAAAAAIDSAMGSGMRASLAKSFVTNSYRRTMLLDKLPDPVFRQRLRAAAAREQGSWRGIVAIVAKLAVELLGKMITDFFA